MLLRRNDRVISQRCQSQVASEVQDAFVAAGDGEVQPFYRLEVISLKSIKSTVVAKCARSAVTNTSVEW